MVRGRLLEKTKLKGMKKERFRTAVLPSKLGKVFKGELKTPVRMGKNAEHLSKVEAAPTKPSKTRAKVDDSISKVIFESPLVKVSRVEMKITKVEEGKPCNISLK